MTLPRKLLGSVILLTSVLSLAQATAARPEFEVASIKQSPPASGGKFRMSMTGDAGRITYQGVTLRVLVARAYRLQEYQVNGPDWMDSQRFDMEAKLPAGSNDDQVPDMLQSMLESRFQMKLHHESKEIPIYALVLGKGGMRIKESTEPPTEQPVRIQLGHLDVERMTLGQLSDLLTRFMDRPVVNMTGAAAPFKIKLDWEQDLSVMLAKGGAIAIKAGALSESAPPSGSGPSIFTAVQEQLGLKLEARKAPMDVVVIDHAEKVPTEN